MKTNALKCVIVVLLFRLLSATVPAYAANIYTYVAGDGTTYYTNRPGPERIRVSFPLTGHVKRFSVQAVPGRGKAPDYEPLIVQAGAKHAVDPDLIRAVIKVESNFNHRAVSPKGASGLMQLMPQTARELGVDDPFEPAANIDGGAMYLSRLLGTLEGNLALSLAAYNAGLERVIDKREIPPFRETRNYVKQVLNYYSKLKGR